MTGAVDIAVTFTVYGKPRPKGSLRHVGHGRLQEQVDGTPWREAIKTAARAELAALGCDGVLLTGPVSVIAAFCFSKPKSAPRTRRIWPITRGTGDLDKHARNLLDALVDAGVMGDDSQVVRLSLAKHYCGDGDPALAIPGARVTIYELTG